MKVEGVAGVVAPSTYVQRYGLVFMEVQRGNLSSRNCSLDEVDFVASAFEFGCVENWQ